MKMHNIHIYTSDKSLQFPRKFHRFQNAKRLFIVHSGTGFVGKGFRRLQWNLSKSFFYCSQHL